jgi:hypothetical protein
MARQQRRYLALDHVDFIVAVSPRQIEEDGRDLGEGAATPLKRLDGVRKSRRRRVRCDSRDLPVGFLKRRVEGRSEMLQPETFEGRRVERPSPAFEKRVASLGFYHAGLSQT